MHWDVQCVDNTVQCVDKTVQCVDKTVVAKVQCIGGCVMHWR